MDEFRYRLARFFAGRCGVDDLGRFLSGLSVFLLILSLFQPLRFFYLPALILLVLTYVRMFSKNIQKRYNENARFLSVKAKVMSRFPGGSGAGVFRSVKDAIARTAARLAERKDYHIYRCPSCSQKIRIPRGKGKIIVRCPKCGSEFRKNS